jgi:hypothetical protein
MKSSNLNRTACTLLLVVIVGASGCGTLTRQYGASESRYWDCEYTDKYTVFTEPPGCRVYVQDDYKGTSPVSGSISGLKFKLEQTGRYQRAYDWDQFWGTTSNDRRATGTDWSGRLAPSAAGGYYVVKASKEGYSVAEKRIDLSTEDDVFRRAVEGAKPSDEGRLHTTFTGKRTILLTLRPIPGAAVPSVPAQQQQQQQQQTVVVPGGVSDTRSERRGSVIVTSEPENCEVYADGLFVGNTPTNLKLGDGVHIIEVRKHGYQSFKRELRVLSDSELNLRAHLQKD